MMLGIIQMFSSVDLSRKHKVVTASLYIAIPFLTGKRVGLGWVGGGGETTKNNGGGNSQQ